MNYLLDTNIYINCYDRYYRMQYFPTFWQAFSHILNQNVVIPRIIMQECYQDKQFIDWINQNYTHTLLNHTQYYEGWAQVIDHIASHDCYRDAALTGNNSWANDTIADGWLIAIAKKDDLVIVSNEVRIANLNATHPSKSTKIPNIAEDFGIRCITMNDFFAEVNLNV